MGEQPLPRSHPLPTGAPRVQSPRPLRSFIIWAALAAVAGALVGLAIEIVLSVLGGRPFELWFVQQSVVFAEAIALSALFAARYAFPLFETLQPALRYTLVLLTLLGSTISITALSIFIRPGVVLSHSAPSFVALVAANTVLALVVGGALMIWERMKRSLARAYEELRIKEAFEREMALARDVQQALLPEKSPEAPGYEIAHVCRTAALVGGDTIDFVSLPDGRLGVAVGDVAGKGIAAALLMANVQAMIRAVAVLETDPARINEILSESLESRLVAGRYVTFAYLVLDPTTGRLHYSLAGHPPPLIVGETGPRRLERGGVPLGLLPGFPTEGGQDQLAPGETLIVYTDGLTEAHGGGDPEREFGQSRLIQLAESLRGAGARETLDRIVAALDEHLAGTPPQDDTTLVVVHRPIDGGR